MEKALKMSNMNVFGIQERKQTYGEEAILEIRMAKGFLTLCTKP